jgi:hypothetical protein
VTEQEEGDLSEEKLQRRYHAGGQEQPSDEVAGLPRDSQSADHGARAEQDDRRRIGADRIRVDREERGPGRQHREPGRR